MSERRHTPEVSRLFIPERHFLTEASAIKYLDDDGNLRRNQDGTFDFELIEKPLVSAEIPVVDIDAYAASIKSHFKPDAVFPRIYNKDIETTLALNGITASARDLGIMVHDNIEHAQQQMFYKKQGKITDMAAWRFCDKGDRTISIQWLIHNVVTNIYADTVKPPEEIRNAHNIGSDLSLDQYDFSIYMQRRGQPVSSRLDDIRTGRVLPKILEGLDEDELGDITPEDLFELDKNSEEHFKGLSRKVKDQWKRRKDDYYENMPDNCIFASVKDQVYNSRPRAAMIILGNIATREPWAFAPYFNNKLSLAQAKRVQRNRYARRLVDDSRLVA